MIKRWIISNFKSIREQAKIEFAPLTLFVGQNSAGKSTLIQSILLTAQTIQSNVTTRSVVLNGRIIRLGSFGDIRANNSPDDKVTVGFELERPPYGVDNLNIGARARYYYAPEFNAKMNLVCTSFAFSAGPLDSYNKELQLQPHLEHASITYNSSDASINSHFEFSRRRQRPEEVLLGLEVSLENVQIPDLSALDFQLLKPSSPAKPYGRVPRMPAKAVAAGVLLRHFLPMGVAAAYDAVSEEVDLAFDLLVDAQSAYRFRNIQPSAFESLLSEPTIRDIFVDASIAAADGLPQFARQRFDKEIAALRSSFSVEGIVKVQTTLQTHGKKALAISLNAREPELKLLLRANRPQRKEIAFFPVTEPIAYAADYVTSFFSERLKYLGPLRDEPKAIYPLAGYNDPKDIGFRGEFTAAVLDNNKTSPVIYIPSAKFPFDSADRIEPIETHLVDAVRDWLEYLGIARAVATEDKGKLGHELTIATAESDQLHDLTHVGVGVSQALPIVVLSLLADSGSTLIFEQPELHLHPKVQTRLADFFMSLVFVGKQCVVETHSEYLISRLRYLSAVAKDVPISELIKIYFVEKPADQSLYNEVQINERGVIKDWPVGFFDETERNSAAIIEAQIERSRKRRQRSETGDPS